MFALDKRAFDSRLQIRYFNRCCTVLSRNLYDPSVNSRHSVRLRPLYGGYCQRWRKPYHWRDSRQEISTSNSRDCSFSGMGRAETFIGRSESRPKSIFLSGFQGCMVGGVAGDCLGAPFEGEVTVAASILRSYIGNMDEAAQKRSMCR